ncbi:MAG: hypothetical protein II292_01600 [Clostridia bacterium]|jgi:hypothetical protein|nr:hypothetical protein [Clostridia bacterium]
MQRGFLNVNDNGIFLLGFPLKLSPTEQKLLVAICERDATIEELSTLLCEGVSRQNVAVHINSINRKAELISGRRLVIFTNECYTLNPYM